MTENQIRLLKKLDFGEIDLEDFYLEFGINLKRDFNFVRSEIEKAIISKDSKKLDLAIRLIWFADNHGVYLNDLNKLLINPNHTNHQTITKTIQEIANPSSILFIKKVLESNFDFLEYTCSDDEVIAKWFSYALHSIGTEQAIELIREFSESKNEGIKNEMKYRLDKIKK